MQNIENFYTEYFGGKKVLNVHEDKNEESKDHMLVSSKLWVTRKIYPYFYFYKTPFYDIKTSATLTIRRKLAKLPKHF